MEKGSAKIAIIVLIILILAAGGFLGYKIVQNKNVQTANEENNENDVLVAGVKQEKEIEIFKGNDTEKLLDDLQLNLLGTLPMNAGLGNVSVGVYKDGDEEVEGLFNPIVINLLNSLKEIEAKKTQA